VTVPAATVKAAQTAASNADKAKQAAEAEANRIANEKQPLNKQPHRPRHRPSVKQY